MCRREFGWDCLGNKDTEHITVEEGGLEIRGSSVFTFQRSLFIVFTPYKCLIRTIPVQETVVTYSKTTKTRFTASGDELGDRTKNLLFRVASGG
jgi:hypothetical protein